MVALSESFGKNELTLVHDGDTHTLDTALDPRLVENLREVGEEVLHRLVIVSGGFNGGHCQWDEEKEGEGEEMKGLLR